MIPAPEAVDLADGRTLDVLLGGATDGTPLVLHHGTPSCATTFEDWHSDCLERGLRLIAVSRPGYASSSRVPGRDVASVTVDIADVLDRLGHGTFVTAGWSGGGPHALACGALLPGCVAGASVAGARMGGDDPDFTAGMAPENVAEFGAALEGEDSLRAFLAANAEPFRTVKAAEIIEAFGGLVPQVDKDVLAEGYAEVLAASMRRALQPGFDGWVDDDLAFVKPWGFQPQDIAVPVTVWQGSLDLMVPFEHGRWLESAIPGATLRLVDGHGHLSLVTAFRSEILDDLVRAAKGQR